MKSWKEKIHLVLFIFLTVSLQSCKPRPSAIEQSQLAGNDSNSCSHEQIKSLIDILASHEQGFALAQKKEFATIGDCTAKRKVCENNCNSEFKSVVKLLFKEAYGQCSDYGIDVYKACMDANKQLQETNLDGEKPYDELAELMHSTQESLHRCTTTKEAMQEKVHNLNPYNGSRSEELTTLDNIWVGRSKIDSIANLTNRFSGATYYDLPPRRHQKNKNEWIASGESDVWYKKYGLRLGQTASVHIGAYVSVMSALEQTGSGVDIPSWSKNKNEGMSLQRNFASLVSSCNHVKDICSAISCLGHRTQELLSFTENLAGIEVLDKTIDNRAYPVCRHYSATFVQACNNFAKNKGITNSLSCVNDGRVELIHAFPEITLKDAKGKEFQYIYDVTSDPLVPDLIPVNDAAMEINHIPCLKF